MHIYICVCAPCPSLAGACNQGSCSCCHSSQYVHTLCVFFSVMTCVGIRTIIYCVFVSVWNSKRVLTPGLCDVRIHLQKQKPTLAGMPYPQNVETALNVESQVRKEGAIPATIAVVSPLALFLCAEFFNHLLFYISTRTIALTFTPFLLICPYFLDPSLLVGIAGHLRMPPLSSMPLACGSYLRITLDEWMCGCRSLRGTWELFTHHP